MNLDKDYVKLTLSAGTGNIYLSPDMKPQGFAQTIYKSENESKKATAIYFPGNMHIVSESVEDIVKQYDEKRTKSGQSYFSNDIFGQIEKASYDLLDKGTRPTKIKVGEKRFQEVIDGLIPKELQHGHEWENASCLCVITRFGVLLVEPSTEETELTVS